MAIKTFSVGEVLTASDTNTYLANSGLVYITSTTFSAVASVQINSCITTTYDGVRIVYSGVGTTTGNDFLLFRWVDGTTPVTTAAYYHGVAYVPTGGAWANSWAGSQTSWKVGVTGNVFTQCIIDVFNGSSSTNKKTFNSNYFSSADGDALWGINGGLYNASTQFEGIQLLAGSGTITGTITVYGYRKA